MSIVLLPAVAFLVAVLLLAEFVWLREEAEERARDSMSDDVAKGRAPRRHPATFAPRQASAKVPEDDASDVVLRLRPPVRVG